MLLEAAAVSCWCGGRRGGIELSLQQQRCCFQQLRQHLNQA
jgi:hypothetical protein